MMATKREKVDSFLKTINTAFPLIKRGQTVDEVDLINNDKFIRSAGLILFNIIKDKKVNIKSRNLNTNKEVLACKEKRQYIIEMWASTILPDSSKNIYSLSVNELQDNIIIDFIDEDSGKWLDLECAISIRCEHNFKSDIFEKYTLDELCKNAEDFIDYNTLLVARYIFLFTRRLDDNSKFQILGNVGSFDDIRTAVKYIFIYEMFNYKKVSVWYNNFLGDNKEILLLPKEKFIKNINKKRGNKKWKRK